MLSLRKQSIKVTRDFLLQKIKENHTIYLEQYKETVKDYEDLVRSNTAKLNEELTLQIFNKETIYFNVRPPIDHSDKYLTIIEMLECSVDETIELDTESFKAYVKNQWDWSESFNTYARSLKGG